MIKLFFIFNFFCYFGFIANFLWKSSLVDNSIMNDVILSKNCFSFFTWRGFRFNVHHFSFNHPSFFSSIEVKLRKIAISLTNFAGSRCEKKKINYFVCSKWSSWCEYFINLINLVRWIYIIIIYLHVMVCEGKIGIGIELIL